jgi:aspartyl-tRNA(Asn)/glutamyl-tRNA(Gln) amidotransferase subunit A
VQPDRFDTAVALRSALDAGRASSRELVDAALARAEAAAPLRVFTHLQPARARAAAAAADERRARGASLGPLDGIPVAIKDLLVQEGEPCTCASRILEGFVAPYQGTAVAKLEAAGAVIVGRTNMDEFAMGSSSEHSPHGAVRNPCDPARTPGGSSGGSAVAVAAGVVPIAFGSDTGGSIRQPASHCGVVGLKPTYGRVSRYGLVAFASSLDQIGPFARTAVDCVLALEAVAGHDPADSTSLPEPVPRWTDALTGDVSGLVIGIPREYFAEGADPAVIARVRDAIAELERAGAKTREVSLPHAPHAIATYYLIATAEASSNLARYDGVKYGRRAPSRSLGEMYRKTRSEGFGAEVKRRILLGTYVLSAGYYDAYYRKAMQVRTLLRRDFESAFSGCDLLATPTAPEVAFRIGEKTDDPVKMYLSDIYTVSANLAGIPGLSLPCGTAHGLPVGLQLLGRPLDEATLFRVADAYQRRTQFHVAHPDPAGWEAR